MKQKYLITKDPKTKQMTIQEFAELDKDIFSLVCEEAYDGKKIKSAVSEGKETLIQTLRTPNLYPVAEYADKIADSVIDMFNQGNQNSIEIAFDDIEALKKEKAAKAGEDEEDEAVALDELLNDDVDDNKDSVKSADTDSNDDDDEEEDQIDEDSLDLFDNEDSEDDEDDDED